jgi:hypothetical protein
MVADAIDAAATLAGGISDVKGGDSKIDNESIAASRRDPELDVPVVAEDKSDTMAGSSGSDMRSVVGFKANSSSGGAPSKGTSRIDETENVGLKDTQDTVEEPDSYARQMASSEGSSSSTSSPSSGASFNYALGKGDNFSTTRMARPHHLPKMESLSRKLEEIKSSMGEFDGSSAPWDATGRPVLGGVSKK